jgi:hypothetical protein
MRVWEEQTPTGEEPKDADSGDLGLRHDARAGMPSVSGAMSTALVVEEYLKSSQKRMPSGRTPGPKGRPFDQEARACCLCGGSNLRDLSQSAPERPAQEVLEADVLAVIAAQTVQTPAQMTMGALWEAVA